MNNSDVILAQLEKELDDFTKRFVSFRHLLWDSFNDHRNRYKGDLEIIDKNFTGGKILDIGSNPFHLMIALKKMDYDVVGLDINPELFKSFIKKNHLDVKKCDIEIEKIPFKENLFDFIIFNEVFEHLRINPIQALKEVVRVLKPGGLLLLTTPNLYALHKIIMFNIGKSFNNAYYEFNQLNIYGYVGHVREYSTSEVKEFLEKSGLVVREVNYRSPYSFYRYDGFKNPLIKIVGLMIDSLMFMVPNWRRDQVFIAKKIKSKN